MRLESMQNPLVALHGMLTVLLLSGVLSGCNGAPSPSTSAPPPAAHSDEHDHGHEHAHASEGPHHGELIELGNEDYHAEMVHGDAGEITVYILDSAAKNPVPIEATEITINLSHAGEAEQFALTAAPQDSDPAGQSSRFTLQDEHLAKDLDDHDTTAKLVLTIAGQQFNGKIEHDHDHADHDHDHPEK